MILKELYRGREEKGVEINIAPLMDMVFILLIFFAVTTSFLKPAGIEINRPTAKTALTLKSSDLIIAISAAGVIYAEGRPVELASLYGIVSRNFRAQKSPDILIAADELAPTGILVKVMDECRRAGATNIALSAKRDSTYH
ncbi:MAG: biopolymer transporter ExbD [Myxococcota bacterium]